MIYTIIISSILLPLLVVIVSVSLATLIIGILGILKTPSLKGKMGILLSILIFIGCCSAMIIFLVNSNREDLHEALFRAALTGNSAKAKELVAKGADIDGTGRDGFTLLRRSIVRGDFQMFKTLVEAGANVNDRWIGRFGDEKQTPIQLVLERSYYHARNEFDYDAVKLLIEYGAKFDFNAKGRWRKTCLQNTIEKRQSEILKLMLDNGANINFQNDAGGVLHWAIGRRAARAMIELLLAHNADVNAKNSRSDTPLHLAVFGRRKDVVSLLIGKGADVSVRNDRNMTALELAQSRQKPGSTNMQEIIDLLEQKKDTLSKQCSDANKL